MRYSSAAVLSTIVVGQAAAANLHNRHASFHARRQAEAKRSAGSEVDWSKVAVDLKEVNWDEVNWSSVFASPTPTPVAVATPTPTAEQKKTTAEAKKPEPTSEVKVEAAAATSTKAAAATSTKAAAATSTKAEKPSATTSEKAAESTSSSNESLGDAIGDIVSDVMHGVETLASKLGCKVGKNDKSNNGGIWIGNDSDWTAEFTNDRNEDAVLYCWKADGFTGMSINKYVPDISVGIKSGQSVELSFAPNVPAACAPAFEDTKLAMFGGLDQTWWEVTFGEWGAFDVSRNVNMKGNNIHSKGSKCTSNMDTCVFKCKDDSKTSCESGSDYDLFNCGSSAGGGSGYDVVMQGTGGGCSMGSSGEKINVVFS